MEQIKPIVALVLVLPFLTYYVNAQQAVIDITKYGAQPGGDIREPLLSAWKEAINSTIPVKIVIPTGTWPLSQAIMEGPNQGPIELEVQGTLEADLDPGKLPDPAREWITINYVNFLTISGGGVFDGKGQEAWKMNDCNKNFDSCKKLPINLSLNFINNSLIHDVTTKDSKNFHVNCISSSNVTFLRFTISAPAESPNTDGIHIARATNINVIDTNIATGDDCVSIGDETTEVHIENVVCGPGHGISVGSLGKNPDEKDVTGIYAKNCTFHGTSNGVRIKTWPSAPAVLQISDIHFEDLIMDNVSNPIVIDQQYCPHNLCQMEKPSLIKISKVSVKNVKGTSNTAEALTLICSSGKPCENVEIADIDLSYVGTIPANFTTICQNIMPTLSGLQNPPICSTTPGGVPPTAATTPGGIPPTDGTKGEL